MGRARVEGHITIYESVKVILVVGVALSLSFSSPLPPLASHSFVARRSSRPLSSSPSSSTSIWSSSKPSSSSPSPPHSSSSHVARRGLLLLLIFAVHLPPSIVAVAVAARDCFALPDSFSVILCRPVRGIASRYRAASLALIIDNIDSVCARHHHCIDSACARDCFALPNSLAGAHH